MQGLFFFSVGSRLLFIFLGGGGEGITDMNALTCFNNTVAWCIVTRQSAKKVGFHWQYDWAHN